MSAHAGEEIIEDYLRQLREALRSTSPGQRDQIVSDVAQHIAEARAEEPCSDELAISRLLGRIGTPEAIAAASEEAGDDTGLAPVGGLQPPSPVRAAVRLMYAGAAMSIITAVADLLTRSGLKSAEPQQRIKGPRSPGAHAWPGELVGDRRDRNGRHRERARFLPVGVHRQGKHGRPVVGPDHGYRPARTGHLLAADGAGGPQRPRPGACCGESVPARCMADRARRDRAPVAKAGRQVLQRLATAAPRPLAHHRIRSH